MQLKLSLSSLMLFHVFAGFSQEEISTLDQEEFVTDDTVLEEVVVVDSRFEIKRSQSGKTIIKITEKELKNYQGRSLPELLQTYGGINLIGSRSPAGQNLTFSIRGGRNNQVLILIDGVRVSDPSRISNDFDLNLLNLANIVSIEIVKGAASTLYGSSASTGVVNITTKKSSKKLTVNLGSTIGTQQAANTAFNKISYMSNFANFSGTKDSFQYKLSLGSQNIYGLSSVDVGTEIDPFIQTNFGFQLGRKGKHLDWNLTFNKDHSGTSFDNVFETPSDNNSTLITDLERFSLSSTYAYDKGSLHTVLGLQNTDRVFAGGYNQTLKGSNLALDVFNKYIIKERFYSVLGYAHQNTSYAGAPSNVQNDVYLNFVYLSTVGFNFNLGSRLNNHDTYGSHFTYSINPSYSFRLANEDRLKIISSISSAFIPPSSYQLYDFYSGNLDLKPEENTTLELGAEWNSRTQARASLVFFKRTEDPTLIYDLTTFRYGNSEERVAYSGIEFEYQNKLFDVVDLRMNYTYNETELGSLINLPKHAFGTVIDYDLSSATHLNTSIQHTGSRVGLSSAPLDAYTLVDAKVSHQFKNQKLSAFFILANIFDADYIEIENYSTQGRNFRLGVNLSF
jgi:vitamin B12 transporter